MNFRNRIITTFLLFAISLTTVFGLLLDNLMPFVEDRIIRDFLLEHLDYIENRIHNNSNKELLIQTPKLKAYLTRLSDVPDNLPLLSDGFHDTEDTHLLVRTLTTGDYAGEKLILVFDESTSFLDKNEGAIILIILLFSVMIIALAAMVCIYLAKSIASPIEYLAVKVSAEHGITDTSVLSRKDELGSLARAFSLTVEKIHDVLEREKKFTRYASHEMRTPLTVVKNNIEILDVVTTRLSTEGVKSNEKMASIYKSSMARLNQAVWFMEQQITTLLLLARGEYQPSLTQVQLPPLLSRIEIYFPDLTIQKKYNEALCIHADATVLQSILINIFNNVMEHGADNAGKATASIEATPYGFSVSNITGPILKKPMGKRFGLEIIAQLCDVMGWHFSLAEKHDASQTQFVIHITYAQ